MASDFIDTIVAGDLPVAKSVLDALKLKVRRASTLRSLKQQIERRTPALLVCNTELGGTELVESMCRAHPQANVLFLTKKPPHKSIEAMLRVGAVDVLRLPCSAKEYSMRVMSLAALSPELSTHDQSLESRLQSLHDETSGRIDAKRVADAYGMTLRKMAKALGENNHQTVAQNPSSKRLQARLGHLRRAYELMLRLRGSEQAVRAWLNTPHPDLSGETPIAVVEQGEGEALRDFLEILYAGGPT